MNTNNQIAGSGGDGCFRKGTLVQQENGRQIAIELLKQGDEVLSFDEQGIIYVSKVTVVHYHEKPEPLVRIKFWNGLIDITPNHWVLNQYGSFAEAGNLKENDAFIDGLGHLRPIVYIEVLEPEPVWNLTVEPNHTFIANGIRVHNGGYRNRYPVAGSGGDEGGGKGGGGAQHVPTEEPDNLFSKQFARVVDLISEGEIEGLVNGYKSIYLDGTPVQSSDGTMNFSGITFDSRNGTQSQSYMAGFGTVEAEVPVSTEVKYGIPVVRTISTTNINATRITLGFPTMTYQDPTTGDLSGTSINITIEVNTNSGGYVTVVNDTITGKTTSLYQRNYRLELAGIGPWSIRISRITADSTQANLRNETWWSSYTELSDSKLRYPNSAVFASSIDSSQFKSIPARGYDIKGVKVKIPNNYNPLTRVYTGVWNGGFTVAWTDNPAWCFYDIITNDRYGVGAFISDDQVDKWALYTIAQYCDQLVNNGFGSTEPRFTCNLYIQTREEAYKVINAMASIFRGLVYWASGTIVPVQDSPQTPVALFTPANVIEGTFNYEGTSIKARHTVVLVSWNDPSDQYRQKIEYVEDVEGIERFGIIQSDLVAFGCTSRGQAHRIGKWLLYTERLESEIITFRTGLDGLAVNPGDIIKTTDPIRAGKRRGGRVVSANTTTINIDNAIDIESGKTYTLWCVMPDGTVESKSVVNGIGSITAFVVATPFSAMPLAQSIWVLGSNDLIPETWRVISITEADKVQAQIIALAYREDKFNAVENDLILNPLATTNIRTIPSAPRASPGFPGVPAGDIQDTVYFNGSSVSTKIIVSWQPDNIAYRYIVRYRKTNENWVDLPSTSSPSIELPNVVDGASYTFRIWSVSALGIPSPDYLELSHTVIGKLALPSNTPTLYCSVLKSGINLSWNEIIDVDRSDYGICRGDLWSNPVTWVDGTSLSLPPCTVGSYTYQIRSRDTTDNLSTGSIIQISKSSPAIVTLNSHGYINNNIIRLDTSDTLPVGLSTGVDYYVNYINANTFNLKASAGGLNINTIDFGFGTHYVIKKVLASFIINGPLTTDPVVNVTELNNSSTLTLTWDEPYSEFQIDGYDISYGPTFVGSTYVATVNAQTFSTPAKWVGTRRWWVVARDIANNVGVAGFEDVGVTAPTVINYTSQVLDNNVLLYWTGVPGTLLIDTFEFRKGSTTSTWETATAIGTKTGGFTSLFETNSGTYKYWIAAIDTAGNTGTPVSVTNTVAQPPDYVLKNNYYTNFSGTKTNMFNNGDGTYACPINTTETYAQHFTSLRVTAVTVSAGGTGYLVGNQFRLNTGTSTVNAVAEVLTTNTGTGAILTAKIINAGIYSVAPSTPGGTVTLTGTGSGATVNATIVGNWATPQAQIDASYPIYIQPNASPGSYVETIDYGTALPSNKITVTLDAETISGTVTNASAIATSLGVSGTYSQTGTAITITAPGTWTIGDTVTLDFTSGTAVDGTYTVTTGGSGTFVVTGASGTTSGTCHLIDNINSTWTTYTGVWSAYGTNFRYVKVTITFTASGLTDLINIRAINIRLDSKLKTSTRMLDCIANVSGTYVQTAYNIVVTASGSWAAGRYVSLDFTTGTSADGIYLITTGGSGTFTVISTVSASTSGNCTVDADGTPIYLTDDETSTGVKTFLDVDAINISPSGTTSITPVYNFVDEPNPLSLKALLFNSAGTRVSGTASITVRGF